MLAWALCVVGGGVTALAGLSGCGDNTRPSQTIPDFLAAYPDMTLLKPGGVGVLTFQVLGHRMGNPEAEPGVGKILDLTLEDDPATVDPEPRGATLSAALLTTNEAGQATLKLTAGLETTFRITARLREAPLETAAVVVVSEGRGATLQVQPVWLAAATPPPALTRVSVRLFDGRSCSSLSARPPSTSVRNPIDVSVGGLAVFSLVTGTAAAQALGYDDGGTLRASGCLDLPSGSLKGDATSLVALPLAAVTTSPLGTFVVRTTFSASTAAEVPLTIWRQVASCPLGLEGLWLDQLVAALPTQGMASLASVLASHRLSAASAGAGSAPAATAISCPAAALASGAPSLERILANAFSAGSPVSANRAAVARDVTSLFDSLVLTSSLMLAATPTTDRFEGTHALSSVAFSLRGQTREVSGVALGVPGQIAYDVPVTRQTDGSLLLAPHSLALRLGTLAEASLPVLVWRPRGLPEEISSWVAAWVAESNGTSTVTDAGARPDAGTSGGGDGGVTTNTSCTTFDRLLCQAVQLAPGCLGAACGLATSTLGDALAGSLRELDGKGTDLTLAGSVLPTDLDGDGLVDDLGSGVQPGLWSLTLTTSNGPSASNAIWTGVRESF